MVHSNSAIKTYVFSAENMTKLEKSYKQVLAVLNLIRCEIEPGVFLISWKTMWLNSR